MASHAQMQTVREHTGFHRQIDRADWHVYLRLCLCLQHLPTWGTTACAPISWQKYQKTCTNKQALSEVMNMNGFPRKKAHYYKKRATSNKGHRY